MVIEMDENRYNILYLNKNSVCSTKSKSEESEKETIKKSSGDLNNFITGIPRHVTVHKKENNSKIIIDRKLQICRFNCQTLRNVSSINLDLKSLCAIAFKVGFCLLDLLIGIFFNDRVHNILAVILTVTIEVFVVLVFAVSTVLSAILINIDEAYNQNSELNNLKTSPPKNLKSLDNNEDALKLKSDTVTKNKSSTSIDSKINSEKESSTILKSTPQNLESDDPTLSNQSSEYETLTKSLA